MAKCRHDIEETTCTDCLLRAKLKTAVHSEATDIHPEDFTIDRRNDGDGNGQDSLSFAEPGIIKTLWPEAGTEQEILEEEGIEDIPEEIEQESEEIVKKETAKTLSIPEETVPNVETTNLPPVLTHEERFRKRQLAALPKSMEFLVPTNRVCRMSGQPREFFDPVKLRELGESMRVEGQKNALWVKWLPDDPRFFCELIDGERRLTEAEELKWPNVRVIKKEVVNSQEQYIMSVTANFGREGHTPLENANAIDRLIKFGLKPPRIAAIFSKSIQWVYNHQKLAWLDPQVKTLMDPALPWEKSLRLLVALMLVSLPAELQIELAQKVIEEGMSVNAARQYIRRRAKEAGCVAGNPNRTPVEDYNNLHGSLKSMKARLILLLDTPTDELGAMFQHREPTDLEEVIDEIEDLCDKIEIFCGRVKYLRRKPAEQMPLS